MQHGFKVISAPEILPADQAMFRWRRINPFDWTIEHHPNCPIDGTAMETIASLVSLTLPEKIRVGCCPRCGLVGYIDRPSEADIDRYYAETWMGETFDQAHDKSCVCALSQPNERELSVLKSLAIDRSLPVLEIGCGYGRTINTLKEAGFTSIDATEHCPARAEAVRQVFGVNVTNEIPQKRYGLIVSHHVLEHCCDPAGLIRACAERQEPGDWMIHSLPNYTFEPSMGVLFFLPHLWSFSACSMVNMLERAGYTCSPDKEARQIDVVAQRYYPPTPREEWNPFQGIATDRLVKLLRGLGLMREQTMRLEWQRDFDGAVWKSAEYARLEERSPFPRSMTVERVTDFVTQAPIEVQFPGRVEMYVK